MKPFNNRNTQGNQPVDISDPQAMQQPAQRPAAPVKHQKIMIPDDTYLIMTRTTEVQRIMVLLAVANAIVAKGMGGIKTVNVYTVVSSLRDIFENPVVEMSVVQDCLDHMIYKGVIRKSTNNQASTSDGEIFYSVTYGLSKAAWNIVKEYGMEVPQWRIPGMEYDPSNPRTSQSPYQQPAQPRFKGFKSNNNQQRVNSTVSV